MTKHLSIALLAALLITRAALAAEHQFTIDRTSTGGLEIKVDAKPFATYVVDQANKPYLYPIYGPTGKTMTRAFPMEKVEGEQVDHPHHRGITFGHEQINGEADVWAERLSYEAALAKPKTKEGAQKHIDALGTVKHVDYKKLQAGDKAVVVETLDYLDGKGKKLFTEERRLTFHMVGQMRAIDFDQELIATDGPVKFEDAKDAGLSIRVPSSMAVDTKKGGHIINSNGLEDANAWGKPADWCDYNGPVDGEHLGIAFLDHPSSFRHPTNWHVRTYGLFTANPFGFKALDKTQPAKPMDLAAGEHLKLRHRFLFHTGDEKSAKIAEAYAEYSKE